MAKWPNSTARWQRVRRRELKEDTSCEIYMLRGKLERRTFI